MDFSGLHCELDFRVGGGVSAYETEKIIHEEDCLCGLGVLAYHNEEFKNALGKFSDVRICFCM